MAVIYLGIGSNVAPEENLRLAVSELRRLFGDLKLSNVYRNDAVGFAGDAFLNLVARAETELSPIEIHELLERIHSLAGRKRDGGRYVPRTLDIDLLMYDALVVDDAPIRLPRTDVLEYSFVLLPMTELDAELRHPLSGRTMADHWESYDKSCHPLERVDVIL